MNIDSIIGAVNQQTLGDLVKFALIFTGICHVVIIAVILRQITGSDKVGSPFSHKMVELVGYINMILIALILILIIVPTA
jgi:hypothetical protein